MKKSELNVKKLLLPYAVTLLALSALLQLVIGLKDGKIDGLIYIYMAIIAIYIAYFHIKNHKNLARIRFAALVGHAASYLAVNVGFFLNAFWLMTTNSPAIRQSVDTLPIDPAWYGVLVCQSAFWGIGLLIHMVASIASRGYEDLDA